VPYGFTREGLGNDLKNNLANPVTGAALSWYIIAPCMEAEIKLKLDDMDLDLVGQVYYEHQGAHADPRNGAGALHLGLGAQHEPWQRRRCSAHRPSIVAPHSGATVSSRTVAGRPAERGFRGATRSHRGARPPPPEIRRRGMPVHRLTTPWLLTLALAACGGGGSTATPTATATADAAVAATAATTPAAIATPATPVPVPAAPTATPTPAAAAPTPAPVTGVAGFLDLDLTRLANYAAPTLPAYYDGTVTALDNAPASDPVSDRLATLGRVLFHDRRLSVNDTVSCASCHQPSSGFSDPQRFSTGFNGSSFTSAHAMRLGNLRYWTPGSMFWDRRAATLEAQATQPIQNVFEMGFDAANGGLAALLSKMNALVYYPELFQFAFGDPAITAARIQRALAHFQRAMVSSGSRWDTAYATVFTANAPNRALNVNLPGFSAEENRGRQLFMNSPNQGGVGCARCHEPPTFALDADSRSNGLDAGETRLFKSPSLKSVGVGGPYMHDGRFATLAQVIEHYDNGVRPGPALDNRLRGGSLNLSAADKAALVAFLRTLDDTALAQDAKFANPFLR